MHATIEKPEINYSISLGCSVCYKGEVHKVCTFDKQSLICEQVWIKASVKLINVNEKNASAGGIIVNQYTVRFFADSTWWSVTMISKIIKHPHPAYRSAIILYFQTQLQALNYSMNSLMVVWSSNGYWFIQDQYWKSEQACGSYKITKSYICLLGLLFY